MKNSRHHLRNATSGGAIPYFARITTMILVLVGIPLLLACGTTSTVVSPTNSLTRGSRIVVIVDGTDEYGLQGQLEHLLFLKGFRVISERRVRDQVRTLLDAQQSDARTTIVTAEEHVKDIPAEYVLRVTHDSYFDVFYWSFRKFAASIVDLRTGELVTSSSFSGDKGVAAVLKDFGNQISAAIR